MDTVAGPGIKARRQGQWTKVKGPPRQSAAFKLKKVSELNVEQTCAEQGLPILPVFVVLLGNLWELRETEMACAIWDDVLVNFEGSVVM